MAEKRADEIRLYASWAFLIYADGYSAQILGIRPSKDKEGADVWNLTLNPTDELVKRYNLKPNSEGNMIFNVEYPYENLIQLNPDQAWERWFCLDTYDGHDTPEIRKLKGLTQQKEITKLKQDILDLKSRLEVSEEKRKKMETNLPKYIKDNFGLLLEQFQPILEKMMIKKNE